MLIFIHHHRNHSSQHPLAIPSRIIYPPTKETEIMASNGDQDSEVKTDIITLTRFLTEKQAEIGHLATGDFT